ncbi:MAG: lipopolysaccharide biosynthesis protein [Mycobacteriales bacterium]|nr:lipopolysaccharide biosynthesis protein [Mycobacteriales bacterium]
MSRPVTASTAHGALTPTGRGLALGSLALLAARGVSLVGGVVGLGVISRALPEEDFGLWVVVSTLAVLGGVVDGGLTQAMRNRLSRLASLDERDHEAERQLFGTVLRVMGVLALLLAGLVVVTSATVPWGQLVGAQGGDDDARTLVVVVLCAYLLGVPLGLGSAGFVAYHQSSAKGLAEGAQALALLLATLVCAGSGLLALAGGYFLVLDGSLFIVLLLFVRSRGWRWRQLRGRTSRSELRSLVREGSGFWLLAAASIVVFSLNPLVAAHVLGVTEAGELGATQRLFLFLITLHFTVLTPLWSAYAAAAERGEWEWIARATRRSLAATVLLVIVGGGLLLVTAEPLLRLWLGRTVTDGPLVLALVAWFGVYALTNCLSVVLNGTGLVGQQAAFAAGAAVLTWPVCAWLGQRHGPSGIVWGTVLVVLPGTLANAVRVRRLLDVKVERS